MTCSFVENNNLSKLTIHVHAHVFEDHGQFTMYNIKADIPVMKHVQVYIVHNLGGIHVSVMYCNNSLIRV